MAVITRYIVVRNGVELEPAFDKKNDADAYDKMLEAAEKLADFIRQGAPELDLAPETLDALSVFLAKKGPEITKILKGVKPPAAAGKRPDKKADAAEKETKAAGESRKPAEKPTGKGK